MTISHETTYFPGFKTYRIYPFGPHGRSLFRGGQNYRWACEFFGKGWSSKTKGEAVIGAIKLFFGMKPENASIKDEPEQML